mgnify:CR=1 FL=1
MSAPSSGTKTFHMIRLLLPTGSRCSACNGQASELSPDDVLQHLLVERQVRHDLPQPGILLLKLAQPLHLRRHHAGILLLPVEVVAWLIPAFRQISATVVPSSPCLMMNAFCASVNCDALITSAPLPARKWRGKFQHDSRAFSGGRPELVGYCRCR